MPDALRSIAASLGWVLLGMLSIVVGVVALVTVLAMARQVSAERSAVALWVLALLLTFGAPFALAVWKHWGDPARVRATMAWLPTLWNAGVLVVGTALVPDLVGTALRNTEWIVEGELGTDHNATRLLSALGHAGADTIDPGGEELIQPASLDATIDVDHAIELPFNERGNAIFVDVEMTGPEGASAQRRYLFDTGASFTTITSQTAEELGIVVPDDAPTVEFNTASGLRKSRVVYLPSLTIGGVEVGSLLVSVCDACATERTSGLLGLNVMREFVVQMDYQAHRIQLLPRLHEGEPDRAYDIKPVVRLALRGRADIMFGRVRWLVEVENRGQVPLRNVMPVVEFTDGPALFGERIDLIEPGATGVALVTGPVGEGPEGADTRREFTMSIAEAQW